MTDLMLRSSYSSLYQPLPDTEVAQTASFQTLVSMGFVFTTLYPALCVSLKNENTKGVGDYKFRDQLYWLRLMSLLSILNLGSSSAETGMPRVLQIQSWLGSPRSRDAFSLIAPTPSFHFSEVY